VKKYNQLQVPLDSRRSREPLSISEIRNLSVVFVKLLKFVSELKNQYEIATHIKHPQIPKLLSESLAIYHINEEKILKQFNFTDDVTFGKTSDLTGTTSTKGIEVKATGRSNFISLGPNDINSDFLIWLVFDTDNAQQFLKSHKIIIFPNPKKVFRRRTIPRISLKDMLKHWKGDHKEIIGHIPRLPPRARR
jgi:hypothetical protein